MKHLEKIATLASVLVAVFLPFTETPSVQDVVGKALLILAAVAGIALYYLVPRLREGLGPVIVTAALWILFWGLHAFTVIRRPNGDYVQGPFWNTTKMSREEALEGARNALDAFGPQVRVAAFVAGLAVFAAVALSAVLLIRVAKDSLFRKDVGSSKPGAEDGKK